MNCTSTNATCGASITGQAMTGNVSLPDYVPNTAVELYQSSWGYALYVCKASTGVQQAFHFYLTDPAGEVFGPVVKKFSQLKGKTGFDFVYDLTGDFDSADLDTIKKTFMGKMNALIDIYCPERCSFKVVYQDLCDQRNYLKPDIITVEQVGDKEYLNIDTKAFAALVKEQEWSWKALDIKKMLRELELLRCNKDRAYDWSVRDSNGNPYRTVSILLKGRASGAEEAED